MPELHKVDSSDLKAIGYDYKLEILDIKFKSGKIRRYHNVGNIIYEGLMSAISKGIYFNRNIRNHYLNHEVID